MFFPFLITPLAIMMLRHGGGENEWLGEGLEREEEGRGGQD